MAAEHEVYGHQRAVRPLRREVKLLGGILSPVEKNVGY